MNLARLARIFIRKEFQHSAARSGGDSSGPGSDAGCFAANVSCAGCVYHRADADRRGRSKGTAGNEETPQRHPEALYSE